VQPINALGSMTLQARWPHARLDGPLRTLQIVHVFTTSSTVTYPTHPPPTRSFTLTDHTVRHCVVETSVIMWSEWMLRLPRRRVDMDLAGGEQMGVRKRIRCLLAG
jgi:hypothetical protein